jgi:hypothetical protein
MLLGMRSPLLSPGGGPSIPAGALFWGSEELLWGAANYITWG